MFSVYETFMSDGHLWIARSLTCVPPIPPGGCRVHLRNARFTARSRRRSWLTVVVLPFYDQVTLSSQTVTHRAHRVRFCSCRTRTEAEERGLTAHVVIVRRKQEGNGPLDSRAKIANFGILIEMSNLNHSDIYPCASCLE